MIFVKNEDRLRYFCFAKCTVRQEKAGKHIAPT